MALTALVFLELALYASSFVCGIITAASLAVVQGEFGGRCVLYGRVSYNASADLIGVQCVSSPSLCYFASAISVMAAVVCFSLTLYWLCVLCCEGGGSARVRVGTSVILAVCGIFLFFLLVTGCILRIGRDSLCQSIVQEVHNITSCEQAQTRKWDSPFTGEWFYSRLHNAEVATWVNFFFWLIIGVLVLIQGCQRSEAIVGDCGGAPGGLFSHATPEETEPIFGGTSWQE